jgi:hypothetical protein
VDGVRRGIDGEVRRQRGRRGDLRSGSHEVGMIAAARTSDEAATVDLMITSLACGSNDVRSGWFFRPLRGLAAAGRNPTPGSRLGLPSFARFAGLDRGTIGVS